MLDVKPYVPAYDTVVEEGEVVLPSWISASVGKKRVVRVSDKAREQLQEIVRSGELEFFNAEEEEAVEECVKEVLERDIRSVYKQSHWKQGKTQRQQLDRMVLCYQVLQQDEGSNGVSVVLVKEILRNESID